MSTPARRTSYLSRLKDLRGPVLDARNDGEGTASQHFSPTAVPPTRTFVVFDFDETIAAVNVEERMLASPVDAIFGGPARVSELQRLFAALHSQGSLLAVVSFNDTETVTRALAMLGIPNGTNLLQYFVPDLIFGRSVTDTDNREKGVTILSRIIGSQLASPVELSSTLTAPATSPASSGAAPAVRLLFVDDNERNCKDVEAACTGLEGVQTLHVEAEGGIGAWSVNRPRVSASLMLLLHAFDDSVCSGLF